MKYKLTVLLLVIVSSFLRAQTNTSEHLMFKGVPIDGTLNQYVLKMKQSGFAAVSSENGLALLKGDFAGFKDCYIGVSTLKEKDLVHKIAVLFPSSETWSSLSGNYFTLKELLTEKYGKPTDVIEKFDNYTPNDDGGKMSSVKLDMCKYYTTWKIDKGDIQLSIVQKDYKCSVSLLYIDKLNSDIIRSKAKDDL
ncbi:hypothetical protein [Pedobacter sp. UBA4863]|uniref:hypothetical protein n=1 Tax=Pedobacter sp. UBA4863 TaxID=1947060 RepID=UPI0025EC5224|nr:hypothetical protein [Pedobacter sp. UBA4863]